MQIAYLNCLKDSGRYWENGYERVYRDVLFNVLAEGCRIKKLRFFRSRQFRVDYPCNRSDVDRRGHGCHSDMNEVLSRGQILNAIQYGNKIGLINKVSHNRWEFTNL